jgi:hypothetical protein
MPLAVFMRAGLASARTTLPIAAVVTAAAGDSDASGGAVVAARGRAGQRRADSPRRHE